MYNSSLPGAMNDNCMMTNPLPATLEDVIAI